MKPRAVVSVILLAGVIAVIAIAFIVLRRPEPLADALRSGDAHRVVRVAATIDTMRHTGSRHNAEAVIVFGLNFLTRDGRLVETKVERAVAARVLAKLSEGTQILLEYDTRTPSRVEIVDPITVVER